MKKCAVSDPAHFRAEDLALRVEGFGRCVGRTAPEVIEDCRSVILEGLDDRAEVIVAKYHYLFIPFVHPTHGLCRYDFALKMRRSSIASVYALFRMG